MPAISTPHVAAAVILRSINRDGKLSAEYCPQAACSF